MPALPQFSYSARVEAETAKVDLIEMEIGDWVVEGQPNELGAFFAFLGPPPKSAGRNSLFSNIQPGPPREEQFGWMFSVGKGRDADISRMVLKRNGRGSGSTKAGRPLAQGFMQIVGIGEGRLGTLRKRLRFDLKLNPTRYLRHQFTVPNVDNAPERWDLTEPSFETRSIPVYNSSRFKHREAALDGKDNFLRSPRGLYFARPEAWRLHMRRYFEAFEYAVEAEFARAYNEAFPGFTSSKGRLPVVRDASAVRYNFKKVEMYWEFASSNPTKAIRLLEPHLLPLGRDATSREFPNGLATTKLETNSRCIQIVLEKHRVMRIYAKTTKRIRVEILYDFRRESLSRILGIGESRKVSTSLHETLLCFPRLARDAAEAFNKVFEEIEESVLECEPSATPYEFIIDVFETIKDAGRAREIIQLLVENGRLASGNGNSEFKGDVQKLRRKGILKHYMGVDIVTALYRGALRKLQ